MAWCGAHGDRRPSYDSRAYMVVAVGEQDARFRPCPGRDWARWIDLLACSAIAAGRGKQVDTSHAAQAGKNHLDEQKEVRLGETDTHDKTHNCLGR